MNEVLGPGFHRIGKDHYLSDPCERPSLSSGIARVIIDESPAHAWASHPRGLALRPDPTRSMVKGTAVDSLLLGGDNELVCLPVELPNAKGAMYPTNDKLLMDSAKVWAEEQLAAGRTVVKRVDLADAREACAAITERLAKLGVAFKGEHQVTGIWRDGEVLCRMRLDHWDEQEAIIYDVKAVDDAHPKAIAKKMASMGYDIQHAAYVSGVEALRPDLAGRVRMKFVFVEPTPPYEVVLCHPDGELRTIGAWKWRRAVQTFGACLQAGRWPGYTDREIEIPALPWAMSQMMEEASVAA